MTDYDLSNLKLINTQKEEEQQKCSEAINLIRNFVLNKTDENIMSLPIVTNCNFEPLINEINKSKFVKIEKSEVPNYSWISRKISSPNDVVNYDLNVISNKQKQYGLYM